MALHKNEDTQINLSSQQEAVCNVFISAESQALLKMSVCSKETTTDRDFSDSEPENRNLRTLLVAWFLSLIEITMPLTVKLLLSY